MSVLSAYPGGTQVTDTYYGQLTVSNNATGIAIAAAVDATLNTNTDYAQIAGIWDAIPHGANNNVTQQTNSFTAQSPGIYEIKVWANVTSSSNNNRIAVKFAVNGAIGLVRRPATTIEIAGEYNNMAAYGFVQLSAGDVVTLHFASNKGATITWQDMVFSINELKRL